MGIQEVIDYVMETPHNTNRAVLESMLNTIDNTVKGGGMIVELNVVTIDASNVKAVSAISASEVAKAYCSGQNTVFHVPTSDYTFETYFSLTYYTPKYLDVEFDSVESWYYADNNSNLTGPGITNDDGYIEYSIYVD